MNSASLGRLGLWTLFSSFFYSVAVADDGVPHCRSTPEYQDVSLHSGTDDIGVWAVWAHGTVLAWVAQDGAVTHRVPEGWSLLAVAGAVDAFEGLARSCDNSGRLAHVTKREGEAWIVDELSVTKGLAVRDAERANGGWGVLIDGWLLELDADLIVRGEHRVRRKTRNRCGRRRMSVGWNLVNVEGAWFALSHAGEWSGSVEFLGGSISETWPSTMCLPNPVDLVAYGSGDGLVLVDSLRHLGWTGSVVDPTGSQQWPSLTWGRHEKQAAYGAGAGRDGELIVSTHEGIQWWTEEAGWRRFEPLWQRALEADYVSDPRYDPLGFTGGWLPPGGLAVVDAGVFRALDMRKLGRLVAEEDAVLSVVFIPKLDQTEHYEIHLEFPVR